MLSEKYICTSQRAWCLSTALTLSECFLQVSDKVCAHKGETVLRLFLGGPFSVTQWDRFCQGVVSVNRPEGLNLHLFSKTGQLWTRYLFLLVV